MVLIFRVDKGTPPLVRQVLIDKGWEEATEETEQNTVHLTWKCQRFMRSEVENCLPNQRLNHFPKTSEISRKDLLYRNLRTMKGTFGAVYDFFPLTFLLPSEYVRFVEVYSEQETKGIWIAKPTDLSQGKKIFLFRELSQLTYDRPTIVQQYLSQPLTLLGYKFDLRLYVLVTSFKPLQVYLYDDGLVRFATSKYDTSNLTDLFSHLTNTSINKNSPTLADEKDGIGPGCKWQFGPLFACMAALGLDFSRLWPRIKSIVLLTLLSCAAAVPSAPACFELFGFDVIVDAALKPWLLEVNASPALNTDEPTDLAVKHPMLSALVDVLAFRDEPPAQPPVLVRKPTAREIMSASRSQPTAAVPAPASWHRTGAGLMMSRRFRVRVRMRG